MGDTRVVASAKEAEAVGASAMVTLSTSVLALMATWLEESGGCAECVAKIEAERRTILGQT